MVPSATKNQKQVALRLLGRHGSLRLAELARRGIRASTLARLVRDGTVFRASRGTYELVGAEVGLSHDLATVAKRVPNGIVCLTSALQFHEMTLQSSSQVWMAIGPKDRKPTLDHPPTRFVRFSGPALSAAIETHSIDRVNVRIFTPAKTIVDCFRFRRTVGLDVSLEALRMGLRARKATIDEIVQLARALRIWSVIRPYLESTVAYEG